MCETIFSPGSVCSFVFQYQVNHGGGFLFLHCLSGAAIHFSSVAILLFRQYTAPTMPTFTAQFLVYHINSSHHYSGITHARACAQARRRERERGNLRPSPPLPPTALINLQSSVLLLSDHHLHLHSFKPPRLFQQQHQTVQPIDDLAIRHPVSVRVARPSGDRDPIGPMPDGGSIHGQLLSVVLCSFIRRVVDAEEYGAAAQSVKTRRLRGIDKGHGGGGVGNEEGRSICLFGFFGILVDSLGLPIERLQEVKAR